MPDSEDTIIRVNEDTIIRTNEDTIISADKTIASKRRIEPVDDRTRVSRGGSRQRPAVPGRLSGGRVAVVPGEEVQRYETRVSGSLTADVLRTVIDPPVSEARQSRDIDQLEGESQKLRRRGGAFVLIAVPLVTLLTGAVVVAIIFLLSA